MPNDARKLKVGGVRRSGRHPAFLDAKVQRVLETRPPGCAQSKKAERRLLGHHKDPSIYWAFYGHGPWALVAFDFISDSLENGNDAGIGELLVADPEFIGELAAAIARAMLYPSNDYAMAWAAFVGKWSKDNMDRLRAEYGEQLPGGVAFSPPISRAQIAAAASRMTGAGERAGDVDAVGPHLNRIMRRAEKLWESWRSRAIEAGYFDGRHCLNCGEYRRYCECGNQRLASWEDSPKPIRGHAKAMRALEKAADRVIKTRRKA